MSKKAVVMTRIVSTIMSMLLIAVLFAPSVLAAGTVLLTLSTATQTVSPGDIVSFKVQCDNFDYIDEFGPVRLSYDETVFDFVSVIPSETLSGYMFDSNSNNSGIIDVHAVFNEVEDDETGLVTTPYHSDSPIVIFEVQLRVKPNTNGDTTVQLTSAGSFTGRTSNFTTYVGDPLIITINEGVSSDATLSSLSLEGITLTPAFNPLEYEYSANVARDVQDVIVVATTSNLNATYTVDGDTNLENGENIVSIHVLAQDGISWHEYRIFVNRQENYIPEGSGFVDANGVTYTFMNFPTGYDLPDGFNQTTRNINGYTVPVFAKDGIVSVLVYVYNGVDAPAFYFYNPNTHIAMPYSNERSYFAVGRVLTAAEVPENVKIPTGYNPGSVIIEGTEMMGYVNKYGSFIKYFNDDTGASGFYYYDFVAQRFYNYLSVDKTAEGVYMLLFYIFLSTTVIESIFIVIIAYVTRRLITNRNNPRPKRV
ncbi:MAG: cadherin-like beta sandwich domain-containing protein [Saccharofermentans sp.]|nr:cadherin-like beta sandwich domain-containing protein [Saccharofermentans sp.]